MMGLMWVGALGLKLFVREIIFEVLTYVITVPKRYGQTDGQTYDTQSHNRALRSIEGQELVNIWLSYNESQKSELYWNTTV